MDIITTLFGGVTLNTLGFQPPAEPASNSTVKHKALDWASQRLFHALNDGDGRDFWSASCLRARKTKRRDRFSGLDSVKDTNEVIKETKTRKKKRTSNDN